MRPSYVTGKNILEPVRGFINLGRIGKQRGKKITPPPPLDALGINISHNTDNGIFIFNTGK